ncbi:unnamed protein product, partial [Rotaria magnacalcarata]
MEISKDNMEDDSDDNDTDGDSTSEDSTDEQIDDSKQEAELVVLRDAVKSSPYNYQAHIDYINLARQYTNLEHL